MNASSRVAIVTGAGRGLGAAYALELARTGTAVVVNDVGWSIAGESTGERPADGVVAQIRAAGGLAVARYDDISTWAGAESLVDAAIHEFGRLDVLVNNAGIMRDRFFAKMTHDDIDEVVRVHLMGAMYCTHSAWPALRDSGSGRVVFVTSSVGLYGGIGQANYGAAKLGVVGLMNVLKHEGVRDGICVNALAPVARSRMSEPLLDEQISAGLKPELVSPVMGYLCSAECSATGVVLEVGAGLVARVRVVEGDGVWLASEDLTGERLAAQIERAIADPSGRPYNSSGEALARVFAAANDSGNTAG